MQPQQEPQQEPQRSPSVQVRVREPSGEAMSGTSSGVVTWDEDATESADTGGPGGPPPRPPVQRLYEVQLITQASRSADEAAQRARSRRNHIAGTLVGLIALAILAVGVGIAADSPAVWAAAGALFLGAFSVPIAFAARELGVFAETAELVTRLLARAGPSDAALPSADAELSEPTEPMLPKSELVRVLFELGEHLHNVSFAGEVFGTADTGEEAEKEAYLTAAFLAFERAAKAGDSRAACWAGRMQSEQGLDDNAERLYVEAQHPLGCYWLGELHARKHFASERPEEWWLARARDGNLLAAYMLGRLHQLDGSFNFVKSEEVLGIPSQTIQL